MRFVSQSNLRMKGRQIRLFSFSLGLVDCLLLWASYAFPPCIHCSFFIFPLAFSFFSVMFTPPLFFLHLSSVSLPPSLPLLPVSPTHSNPVSHLDIWDAGDAVDVVCAEGRVRVEGVLFRAGQAVTDMYVRSRGSCKGRGVLNNADFKKSSISI